LFGLSLDSTGNLAGMPVVFPDYEAPVARNHEGGRELIRMRWGMPPPPKLGGPPVTNIRNMSSPHWRGWLKPENRCLVPANSFSEYAPLPNLATARRMSSGSRSMKNGRCSLRRYLDCLQRRAGPEIKTGSRSASGLWLSDHDAQFDCGTDSSRGNAGHSDDGRRMGSMDERSLG
jgi:hypothetical protein